MEALNSNTYVNIQNFLFEMGIQVDLENLNVVLGSYLDGSDWIRNRFGINEAPELKIGKHSGALEHRSGLTKLPDGTSVIVIQAKEFEHLNRISFRRSTIELNFGLKVPFRPVLTVEQYFASFGVEEVLHWIQEKGVNGAEPLPTEQNRIDQLSGDGIRYLSQPHELQALHFKGEYLLEKYGENPFAELENFIREKSR